MTTDSRLRTLFATCAKRGPNRPLHTKGGSPNYLEKSLDAAAEPFKGITTNGTVIPGLFDIQQTGVSTQAIREAAATFLDSLRSHRPDCVVLDLHMPEVTGFDVQARLRELDIPVVVITGHDTPESRGRVQELGAAAYLRKPVAAKALLEAIDNAIGANHPTTP